MTADDVALLDRVERAQAELRKHKSAIRQHRIGAQAAAAALDAMLAECRRRGIAPTPGPDRRPGRSDGTGRA
jgi:hypothetical protein